MQLNRVITNGHVFMILQETKDGQYTVAVWFDNDGYVNISDYYDQAYIALCSTVEQLGIDKNTLRYLNGEKLVFPSLKVKEEVIFNYQNTKGDMHKYFIIKIEDKYNLYIINYCGKVDLVFSSTGRVFNYDNMQFTIL